MTRAIVFTDRLLVDENGMFDRGAIARFVVERADVLTENATHVFAIVDAWWKTGVHFREWCESVGFYCLATSSTRSSAFDEYKVKFAEVAQRDYGCIDLVDSRIVSDDPRITIHRQVQR